MTITLRQDFDADFDQITAGLAPGYRGEPYAFVRFGDGEHNIMRGLAHEAKSDGWAAPAGDCTPDKWRLLGGRLLSCLGANLPGFYIGITADEHHPNCWGWLNINRSCGFEKITYAEIFIFANYSRWLNLDTSRCLIVSPRAPLGHFHVPPDAVMTGWDHRPLVDALILLTESRNPILVSAGPLANIIIHDYWLRCPDSNKRVILDVGSAIDNRLKGKRTRTYQSPRSWQFNWKPRFWPE